MEFIEFKIGVNIVQILLDSRGTQFLDARGFAPPPPEELGWNNSPYLYFILMFHKSIYLSLPV